MIIVQYKRYIFLGFSVLFSLLCTSCNRYNSLQQKGDDTWFVKFQTGILPGKCYHMYNEKVFTDNNKLIFQNRSMLPVFVSLSNHSVTRKRVFGAELQPGQFVICDNLEQGVEYCVSLIIDDDQGSKNGIVAVYATDSIIPFNYMEAQEEQHNYLLDIYNKIFKNIRIF